MKQVVSIHPPTTLELWQRIKVADQSEGSKLTFVLEEKESR